MSERRLAIAVKGIPFDIRGKPCGGNISFFPIYLENKEGRKRREQAAKFLCAQCDVRDECLEFALEIRERYGIWGGKTETERRRILRNDESIQRYLSKK